MSDDLPEPFQLDVGYKISVDKHFIPKVP